MELRKLALATLCASSALALPAFANNDAVEPVGKIFLTFDDGPMNATPALIDLLDSMGVKATFYINGWHLDGIGDENEDHALAALQQTLNSGHVIGNHSYDHMIHNCVDEFGPNSAAECNETQGWSIHSYQDPATDVLGFAENMEVVGEYLGDVSQYPNYQMSSLARLPYTNSWRVTHDFQADAPCATSDGVQRECSLEDPYISSKNAIEVSNLLAEQGYQIHGWDLDMWISSPVAFAPEEIEQIAQDLFFYTQLPDLAPELCLARDFFGALNMPCDHPLHDDNFVILAHDFLYEDGKRGLNATNNLPILARYIELALAAGYEFDTMDNYVPTWQNAKSYQAGEHVSFNQQIYVAAQAHTAQANWNPETAQTLWQLDSPSRLWTPNSRYQVGDLVRFNQLDYTVTTAHISQQGWTPAQASSLFAVVND